MALGTPVDPAVRDALKAYARRVRELRRANPDVPEPGLAPAFQRLLDDLMPSTFIPSRPAYR